MYVIFPSNTPAASFPDNTSSRFTVPFTLNTPIDQNWKVGLVHAQIPLTFYNIESDDAITIMMKDGLTVVIHPEEGVYLSPQKIIEMFLQCNTEKYFSLLWDSGFIIKLKPEISRIKFSSQLGRLLGYIDTLEGDTEFKSTVQHFDPWINHQVLLVLCSLVRCVPFNDRHQPVLQTLVLQTLDFGGTFFNYFYPVDLVEVQGECHSSISLSITDLDGTPIRFRSGSVVLGLNFQHDSTGRRDTHHR